jgi:predicted RNA-binding protein with PIN domain
MRPGGAVAEPTLYLFDGHNLLHTGGYADKRELTDTLASFVAVRGARGFLVWDGAGTDAEVGPLSVRHAAHADSLLERLAAEHRAAEVVCLVSSDFAVRGTSGQEVQKRSSSAFLAELEQPRHEERQGSRLADALDAETRERLERLRRGDG